MIFPRIYADEQALAAARAELGTKTLKDIVNEALRRVAPDRQHRVSRAFDTLSKAKLRDRSEGADPHGRHQASFPLIETDASHVQRAREIQRLLADLLIAAAAEQSGLILLHYDADFDLISRVTGQPCEWVFSAGTID